MKSSWNLEKYKNKNFEEFLDETIIFSLVLTINWDPTGPGKSTQPSSDYKVKITMPPMNYIIIVMKSGCKSILQKLFLVFILLLNIKKNPLFKLYLSYVIYMKNE
jgi:hypothetical protein